MPGGDPIKPNRIAGLLSTDFGIIPGGKSQSSYDRGSTIYEINDLNAVRARNQGFWTAAGNMVAQSAATLLGQTVQALGSFIDPVYDFFSKGELQIGEGLTGLGGDIIESVSRNNPIYWDPKQGINMDYIFSRMPSLVSSLSMLIPGWGIARGAGMLGRGLAMSKLGTQALSVGLGSIAMRHAENWMEGVQVYNTIKEQAITGNDPRYKDLGYEEIENAARAGSALTYKLNWANLGFDVLQLASLMIPIKGLKGWTNIFGKESRLAQVLDYGYGTAAKKGMLEGAGKLSKLGLRGASIVKPLAIQTTEGFEEMWNSISQKEGERKARIEAGIEKDDGKSVIDRLPGYMGDFDTWDSFAWGVLGGVVFKAGGEQLNKWGAKAGWWDDTTTKGQLMASLKNRSDVIIKLYKDLSDPTLNEYQKTVKRAAGLYDLVKSNKSTESVDMLLEDLENPKLIKEFSKMMGLNEADTQKELPKLIEDIKYVSERIDQYEGSTTKGIRKFNKEEYDTGLEDERLESVERQRFIHDRNLVLQLAANDFQNRVIDRVNTQIQQELASTLTSTFANSNLGTNSQMVFNTMAEIAALRTQLQNEETSLQSAKEIKVPDAQVGLLESAVKEVKSLLERKEENLKELEKIMNQAVEDKMSKETFTDAVNFAKTALGKDGSAGRYASLKRTFYNNQLDKHKAIEENTRIQEDPEAYIKLVKDTDKAKALYVIEQVEIQKRKDEEAKQVDDAINNLVSENNEEFKRLTKLEEDGVSAILDKYKDDADKRAYLQKELDIIQNEIIKQKNEGKFANRSLTEFNEKFDKQLWQKLAARERVIHKKLTEMGAAPKAGAASTKIGKGTEPTKRPPILLEEFEAGSPGQYYKGLVSFLGMDGKGGSFGRRFTMEGGVLELARRMEKYPDIISELSAVLENYDKATKAGDPNAANILRNAQHLIVTDPEIQLSTIPSEAELLRIVSTEYDILEERLENAEKQLGIGEKSADKASILTANMIQSKDFPEAYKFLLSVLAQYPNAVDVANNLDEVHKVFKAELDKAAKDLEDWRAGNLAPTQKKPATSITSEELDEAMDQRPENQRSRFPYPHSEPNERNPYPNTISLSVLALHQDGNGKWHKKYNGDTAISDPTFPNGNVIYVGKDGETLTGFAKPGMKLTLRFTGEYHGKGADTEKRIIVTDEDGNYMGDLDTVHRSKKALNTLKGVLSKETDPEERARLTRKISMHENLIPEFIKLRSSFKEKDDVLEARIPTSISSTENSVTSGGVSFGSVIQTKDNKPVNLQTAFGLDELNKGGGSVILAIMHDGAFIVTDESGNNMGDADTVHNISIPRPTRYTPPLKGSGSNNGSVFALVPTNTFDQSDPTRRIYLPIKLRTAGVTKVTLTQDGTFEGQTLPEAILDVIMDPDNRSEEFTMLASRVGVTFNPEYAITHSKNRDALLRFFTTENLLAIFKTVCYVYSDEANKKYSAGNRDYSWHIGIDVLTTKSDDTGTRPYIKFDLSNDTHERNKLRVNLFDENGNFAPNFGEKTVTLGQLMTQAEREANPNAAQLQKVIDVKERIKARFRQKLFRVDKRLVNQPANKPYDAIVFEGGRLVSKRYDSYLHYLNDKQILESTIHGVNYDAVDPKTGKRVKGRTYFTDQQIYIDLTPANTKPVASEEPPKRKRATTTGKKNPATPTGTRKRGRPKKVTAVVPEVISTSMALQADGSIRKVEKGATPAGASVEVYKGNWTREEVAKQTDKVFLFGDNTDDRLNTHHVPTSTQAVIRGLPNAIGIETKKNRGTNEDISNVKGENITSRGSEFAKKLTNVGNNIGITYKGKHYVNSEHAYQTWKSGEFNQQGYDLKGGKVRGGKIGDTFSIMVDILTEKLKQHPELIQGINERGGLNYIKNSTHNVIGDRFWESTGQNKFIEALYTAAKNIGVTDVNSSSYFKNADFPQFKQQVDEAIQKAKDSGKTIVIPEAGIGTGKAQLEKRAPELFNYLQEKLNELKNSKQQESSKSTLDGSNDSYYMIKGERHERVSHVLRDGKKGSTSPATIVGTRVDLLAKAVINGAPHSPDGLSEAAVSKLLKYFGPDFKRFLSSVNQSVVATDFIVYGTVTGADGKPLKVAGEIDLLTADSDGNLYIYDFKTSKEPFNMASYKAEGKDGKSRYESHSEQLTAYSELLRQMTGKHAAGIAVIPVTVSYADGGNTTIDNVIPYDPIVFEQFANVPKFGVFSGRQASEAAKSSKFEFFESEPPTDAEFDNFDAGGILGDDLPGGSKRAPLTHEEPFLWMEEPLSNAATLRNSNLKHYDPSRLRDYSRDFGVQKQYEEFTAQLILDTLFAQKIADPFNTKTDFNTLRTLVSEQLDNKIKGYRTLLTRLIADILYSSGMSNMNFKELRKDVFTNLNKYLNEYADVINGNGGYYNNVYYNIDSKLEQLGHLLELRKYFDMDLMDDAHKELSENFVGYLRTGLITLSSNGITDIDVDINDVEQIDTKDTASSFRWVENYAFRINPKTTINVQSKIFLSRIPELDRFDTATGIGFRPVATLFGNRRYYKLDALLSELHMEFEGVLPERFFEHLNTLDTDIPFIRSIVETINKIAEENPTKADQIRNQLSSLIKDRRDMKYLNATITDKGTTVYVQDAARQGITQNILRKWENNFRYGFRNFFDVHETEDPNNPRSTKLSVTLKKQELSFVQKGEKYDTEDFSLPAEFDPETHKVIWQTEWLYNKLKGIANGTTPKRIAMDFENGYVKIGKTRLAVSERDFLMMVLMNASENLVLDTKLKPLFNELKYVAPTSLQQIGENLRFIGLKQGKYSGDSTALKDKSGYHIIYYQMMADQLQKLGIQLAEEPSMSWRVLADMNTATDDRGKRRKYNKYDKRASDFSSFITNTVDKLIIAPLTKGGAFELVHNRFVEDNVGDDSEEGETRRINIETPFGKSLQGLVPFARHARREWYSFANETIRNVNGDLEYTYTPTNALSTMINKLQDSTTGYLEKIAETPMARFNPIIRKMLNSREAVDAISLHYVDGGKINKNNNRKLLPDNITAAKLAMIDWNMYFNGETKTDTRNTGLYITTHSDSTIMPAFQFEKNPLHLDFVESVDDNGVRSYRVVLNETTKDGSPNVIYNNLFGIFRGEFQRVYEAFEAWNDINRSGWSEEQKLEYAQNAGYRLHYHYRIVDGKIVRGNATNMYLFGSRMFDKNNSGLYRDDSKSSLDSRFVDGSGNFNEAEIKAHFDSFINTCINDLINDAYADTLKLEGSFFEIKTVKNQHTGTNDTKSDRNKLEFPILNKDSVSAVESLFKRNSSVISANGRESVDSRNTRLERIPSKDRLMKQGMTEEEAEQALMIAERVRAEDAKAATYNELFLKYLVADKALNSASFFGTFFQLFMDPAILNKGFDYSLFKDEFEKRMKGFVSPGGVTAYRDDEPVKVLGFKDIGLGYFKIDLSNAELTPLQNDFIDKFIAKFGGSRSSLPARVLNLMSFYYSRPESEREDSWDIIADALKSVTTDGGSYITTREWLYRLYRQGKITSDEYFDSIDYYYNNGSVKPLPAKVYKFVYGGNNIEDVGDSAINVSTYIKDAVFPLLPEFTKGTALDEVRLMAEAREAEEYAVYPEDRPIPGLILAPESSVKTAFNSTSNLFNEDGTVSRDLETTKIVNLDRAFLREQIVSNDSDKQRSIISTQGNVLSHLNVLAAWRFGQRGDITFSRMQEADEIPDMDADGIEAELLSSAGGITDNAMQNATYQIFTELATRRFEELRTELGVSLDETDETRKYMVQSVSRFTNLIRKQAVNRFGIGSTALDYLTIVNEAFDKEVLDIPITFTPAAKRLQSVFLSELKDMFYRFTLPGKPLAQISATGLHSVNKQDVDFRTDLKGYTVKTVKTTKYRTLEEARRDFEEEEIHSFKDGVLEYYEFEPAEAMIPWLFKDANGKDLKYEDYVNEDGTPMLDKIDKRLLEFPVFRIPNTGANASAKLRVARFFKPNIKDGIAVAHELMSVIGYDFDYDKLYSYFYNYTVGPDGKISKVESVLHPSQNGQENFFNSDMQKLDYARRRLMKNSEEYRELKRKLRTASKNPEALDEQLSEAFKATKSLSLTDLRNMAEENDSEFERISEQMRLMEEEELNSDGFDKSYKRASVYAKQSVPALENALIDRFNIMFGDFKMLKAMTTPLSTRIISDAVNTKDIAGHSITELLYDNKFHSILSYNSYAQSRLSNSNADLLIGILANAQISMAQGQRWNLSVNGIAYEDESVQDAYTLLFKDSNGNIKEEEDANSRNSTRSGFYSPYTVNAKDRKTGETTPVYDIPAQGRYRLDRIFVINDAGKRVYVSEYIQSALQAALDHQKNPLVNKANLTKHTVKAFEAMVRLGYVDEVIPLLHQEYINKYLDKISGQYTIETLESRMQALTEIVIELVAPYGMTVPMVHAIYDSLPDDHKNGVTLLSAVLKRLDTKDSSVLSTKDLKNGIAQRAGVMHKDDKYNVRQLVALHNFLVADSIGRELFTIQQSTNAYSAGLSSSFAELELQKLRFNQLFNYSPTTKKIKSSVPLIAGIHRIRESWANALGRKRDYRSSMMLYGQNYGVVPSLQMLESVTGNVFHEFTPLFKYVRSEFFRVSKGLYPSRDLKDLTDAEYIRAFNKLNVNFVSFMFSNPELYRNMFPEDSSGEFDAFVESGREMLIRRTEDLPYNPDFTVFNLPESLSVTLHRIKSEINPSTGNEYGMDYDFLGALEPIFTNTGKTPTGVRYVTANAYQDNINYRMAMGLADMYRSNNPELRGLAKKLILYGFLNGGIVTPNSFVQFIPPAILRDFGFGKALRNTLDVISTPERRTEVVRTFMIQFFQHNPFELASEIGSEKLIEIEAGKVLFDNNLGVELLEINPEYATYFKDKYIFRRNDLETGAPRLYVHHPTDKRYLMRIDTAGSPSYHNNEYMFNVERKPVNSLYLHNISQNSRKITEGIEINGEMQNPEDYEDPEVRKLRERSAKSLAVKMMDKPTEVWDLMTDMELDSSNPVASGVLTFLKRSVNAIQPTVRYEELPTGRMYLDPTLLEISVNMAHPSFRGIATGDPTGFNASVFKETMAHELTHMVTKHHVNAVLDGTEKDPKIIQAVDRLVALHEKVLDYMKRNKKLKDVHTDFKKFVLLADKRAAGKALSDADIAFIQKNVHFYGLYTNNKTDRTELEVKSRQINEFVAYAFTDSNFQNLLNSMDFRDRSFWQELLDIILDILGLRMNEVEADAEIKQIKKTLTPKHKVINNAGNIGVRSGELGDSISNLQAYSGLHVALREIISLANNTGDQLLAQSFKSDISGGKSTIKNNLPRRLDYDDVYREVKNYDPNWSDEMKKAYHIAVLNNQIIC